MGCINPLFTYFFSLYLLVLTFSSDTVTSAIEHVLSTSLQPFYPAKKTKLPDVSRSHSAELDHVIIGSAGAAGKMSRYTRGTIGTKVSFCPCTVLSWLHILSGIKCS